MKKIIWIIAGLIIILLIVILGSVVFTQVTTADPELEALAALQSTNEVQVDSGDWLVFQPTGSQPSTGLILYPGGLVDPRAYAPFARDIAAEGYLVVIPSMPLNLAVLAVDRAQKIIDEHPQIQQWAVGGHSLGGTMAAQFASGNLEAVDGLVLWGAYPYSGSDLSSSSLPVVSIFGTYDQVSSIEEIEAAKIYLPSDTQYLPIEGGNHAQFGYYGLQRGDGNPGISHQMQKNQVVQVTVEFLDRLGS